MKKIIRIKTDASYNTGGSISGIVLAHLGDDNEIEETAFYHFEGDNVEMFIESGCKEFDDEPEEDYIEFGDEDGLTDEEYGVMFTKLASIAAVMKSAT